MEKTAGGKGGDDLAPLLFCEQKEKWKKNNNKKKNKDIQSRNCNKVVTEIKILLSQPF